jgi:hypothetical protein
VTGQWEYLHVSIRAVFKPSEKVFEDEQTILTRLGLERWELIKAYDRNPGSTLGADIWGIFKREKEAVPVPCSACKETPGFVVVDAASGVFPVPNRILRCKPNCSAVYAYDGQSNESLIESWNKMMSGGV